MERRVFLLLMFFLTLSFVACDPSSSVSYLIENQTGKAVIVKLKPDFGYCIRHRIINNEWNSALSNDSVVLLDTEYMEKTYEWIHSTPQPHTPLWDGIESIHIGTYVVSENKWKKEDAWLNMIEKKKCDLEHQTFVLKLTGAEIEASD